MHRALHIEELLLNICDILNIDADRNLAMIMNKDQDQRRVAMTALSSLARTCRIFHDPAIGFLWSSQYSLTPLALCLGDSVALSDEEHLWSNEAEVVCSIRDIIARTLSGRHSVDLQAASVSGSTLSFHQIRSLDQVYESHRLSPNRFQDPRQSVVTQLATFHRRSSTPFTLSQSQQAQMVLQLSSPRLPMPFHQFQGNEFEPVDEACHSVVTGVYP
ncbi:hypothetical protein NLI96_g3591 [Meripilus lineatus]|uniref:Uncharacterized protein n=1 Tax=Meripilus lineatus TaxID=2056292 RepID=A0AAD5V656_9APHY|nr:hypothetical protein NLI96_g3591 [Physisporinus lineatus]